MHVRRMSGRRAIAALLVALAVSGCGQQGGPDTSSERKAHGEGKGPLSVMVGTGGLSIRAPEVARWWGSFGQFELCRTPGDSKLEVDRVRFSFAHRPLDTRVTVRHVEKDAVAQAAPNERPAFGPFGNALGLPPAFDGQVDLPGSYKTFAAPLNVTAGCAEVSDRIQQVGVGEVPDGGLQELVVSLDVDDNGGQIDKMYVDYSSDGDDYTLVVPWTMVARGAELPTALPVRKPVNDRV